MNLKSYVIYSEEKSETSFKFLQKYATYFTPISAFTLSQLHSIGDKEAIFNTEKAFQVLTRSITDTEICHTLSHIKCWRAIAKDADIQDHEYGLIAETNIELVDNFYELARTYAKTYSSYGIIKLQCHTFPNSSEHLYQPNDPLNALTYGNPNQYHQGSGLYLLRKDIAKQLIKRLDETKPYWLSDHFCEFYEMKSIAQAAALLGQYTKSHLPKIIDKPLFSVVIPIYNVDRYLKQCIDSILEQNYDYYEIILVNDGSPDNSMDICVEYAKKYNNVVFLHKINGGVSEARNMGMQIARGEYIILVDSDDYWDGQGLPIFQDLEKIVEDNNHPDVIINFMTSVYPEQIIYHTPTFENKSGSFHKDFEKLWNNGVYVGFPYTKILKRELIQLNQLYFVQNRRFEDVEWTFRLVRHIKTYAIYANPFYMYRRERPGSTSQFVSKLNQESLFANLVDINIEMRQLLLEQPELTLVIRRYIHGINDYIMECWKLLQEHERTELSEMKMQHDELLKQIEDYFEKRENGVSTDYP